MGWIVSFAGVVLWSIRDTARPSDAIVVLGAAQYVGRPSPVLRSRLDHARLLWGRGLAPRVILTGGSGPGDTTSEAAVGRTYLAAAGVPDSALLVENQGRSTEESIAGVAALMRQHGMRSALFVSDPFHMLRVELLARGYGLECASSPTRTSPIWANRAQSLTYLGLESVKVPLTAVLRLQRALTS
jgi:uncharacterized SAM-binding protein YcdF (DUF218 family)